jgi:hypothetical protein
VQHLAPLLLPTNFKVVTKFDGNIQDCCDAKDTIVRQQKTKGRHFMLYDKFEASIASIASIAFPN